MIKETDATVGVEVEVKATEAVGVGGKIKNRVHHRLTELRRRRPLEMKVRRGGMVPENCTQSERLCELTKGN
jgi:hypothetical protein